MLNSSLEDLYKKKTFKVISVVFETKAKMFHGDGFPSGWKHSDHVTNEPHRINMCSVPHGQCKLTIIIKTYPIDNSSAALRCSYD